MHTYIHICIYIYTYIYIDIHTYIWINLYVYTHTDTYIYEEQSTLLLIFKLYDPTPHDKKWSYFCQFPRPLPHTPCGRTSLKLLFLGFSPGSFVGLLNPPSPAAYTYNKTCGQNASKISPRKSARCEIYSRKNWFKGFLPKRQMICTHSQKSTRCYNNYRADVMQLTFENLALLKTLTPHIRIFLKVSSLL